MSEALEDVFEEFVAAWARGESPDPRAHLERVDDPEALSAMIDRYLVSAPGREPEPEVVAAIDAWLKGEPTLSTIRVKKGRRVEDVVDAILEGCDLGRERAVKVKEYYQRLEQGLLSPGRVKAPVFDAIGAALGVRATELPVWPGAPAVGAPVMRERPDISEPLASAPAPAAEMASLAADPPDEVDRLFGAAG